MRSQTVEKVLKDGSWAGLSMSLNCSKVQELIGRVWIQAILTSFLYSSSFLPELISNLPVTTAKHHQTSSSRTLQRYHCTCLLRQVLKELLDRAVAIGSRLLTLQNTNDRLIVVFPCLSIFFHEQEQKLEPTSLWASVLVLL